MFGGSRISGWTTCPWWAARPRRWASSIRALSPQGVRVPNGFALTAAAYRDALTKAGAWDELRNLLSGLDKRRISDLAKRAAAARAIVYAATDRDELRREVTEAYRQLEQEYGANVAVAVRSSATAEDLPTASFAGQHESFLNIRGPRDLMDACRRCFASLFTDRAISYRIDNGFDHFKVALSVAVMKMVRSDRAASGVIFTLDTESGFRDVVFVTGAYGLGENIVQGTVDPDEFYVHKPTFNAGFRAVLSRRLGRKDKRMVYARGHTTTRNVATSQADRERFCIADEDVLEARPICDRRGKSLFEKVGQPDADGCRMGEGRQRRRALHHSGPARRRLRPAASPRHLRAML